MHWRSLRVCLELRNIPNFVASTCILHNICEKRGEAFLETRLALDRPMVGETCGTFDDAWAEVTLSVKHPG